MTQQPRACMVHTINGHTLVHYVPITNEHHPSRYSGWTVYRDAVRPTTEAEENTARLRWDAWCSLCPKK